MSVKPFPEKRPALPQMPAHLQGVLFAYDEVARALILVEARAGISLPWLQRLQGRDGKPYWRHVTHEGLSAALPPLELHIQTAPGAGAPLVGTDGKALEMRHG